MMLAYRLAQIFMDVFGIKRAATMIVPKLQNFEQKRRRMDIAQEMLTTFNTICSKIIMAMTLKAKPYHPNGSFQESHVQCVNM